jgi:plasmid maintenance system antidote protein VapI
MSARELARRCGRSAKLVVEILSGKAPIEPETAMQLERVLDMDASVWLKMEAAYRLHLARAEEAESFTEVREFVKRFPVTELVHRGLMPAPTNEQDTARGLLRFFGAGSFAAFHDRYINELQTTSFRHSPSFKSEVEPLFAWLRAGEIEAEKTKVAIFNRSSFMSVLGKIRRMTNEDPKTFLPRMKDECAKSGVIFLLVPPFKGLRLSGIARWLAPSKGIIQQTLRHKTNDHFWFTFFHESAHLLFHSKKGLFIDGENLPGDVKEEAEANAWAANFLVPQQELERFIHRGSIGANEVIEFAQSVAIAPGIVVGRLQKRQVIPWSALNHLKTRFRWA